MKTSTEYFVRIPDEAERFFRKAGAGRRRMLVLTYQFDPKTFERRFDRILQMGVEIDVLTGTPAATESTMYRIWRANWRGTFHVKAIILLANQEVMVGLGSANLTANGLADNLEVWDYFSGSGDWAVLAGVRSLLETLKARRVTKGPDVDEFISALPRGNHGLFISMEGPLMDQLKRQVPSWRGSPKTIEIISPIHGDAGPVVKQLRKHIGASSVILYSESDRPSLPFVEGVTEYQILDRPEASRDEGEQDDPEGVTSEKSAIAGVHAKVYAFRVGKNIHLLWGSANLSNSAWLVKGDKANAEILVHSVISPGEWARFFKKALPKGYSWKKCVPDKSFKPPVYQGDDGGPQLLHAVWDGRGLDITCTHPGIHEFKLRSGPGKPFRLTRLNYRNCAAWLPEQLGHKIWGQDPPPRHLEWSKPSEKEWLPLPINYEDFGCTGQDSSSLVDRLYFIYAGHCIPTPGPKGIPNGKGKEPTDDELELTRSDHQGKLDELVLKWRSVAARMKRASGKNTELLRTRLYRTIEEIQREAELKPEMWPKHHVTFVRELMYACLAQS